MRNSKVKLDISFDARALLFGVAITVLLTAVIVKGAIVDTLERFGKTEKK